jgi:hypothetical protein
VNPKPPNPLYHEFYISTATGNQGGNYGGNNNNNYGGGGGGGDPPIPPNPNPQSPNPTPGAIKISGVKRHALSVMHKSF